MDFSLSEPERDLVALCRDFAQNEIARRAPAAWEEARCPTDLLREMGALGLLGMLVPEEWGGIGMSTVGFVAAMEQIGLADQSVAAAWQAHVTIGSLPLLLFGNDAQRERWLRPLAEGRALGAFGLTEPDAGSDARGIRTRAERQDGGWVINGRKTFISNAGTDMSFGVTLLARTDAGDGDAGRATPASSSRRTRRDSPWARRCAASAGAGSTPASSTSTTSGCPSDHLVGDPAMGLSQFLRTLEVGRISIAALSLSLTQAVLGPGDRTTPGERVQFGQPISKFQAVQFKLADIATELEAARWLTYRAASFRDAGAAVPEGGGDGEAEGQPGGRLGRLRGGADPRRTRLHARVTGRPLLLRRQGARDRRGHQRDPAPGDRPRPRLLSRAPRRVRRRPEPADGLGDLVAVGKPGPLELGRVGRRSGRRARRARMGASRSQNPSRATVAAISAPMPKGTTASWAIRSRLVLCTEASTGSRSSGATVRRSITSTEIPSPASSSAAASASWTMRDTETTVMSDPARTTADRPMGTDEVGRRLRALHAVEQPVLDEHDRVGILRLPRGAARRCRPASTA